MTKMTKPITGRSIAKKQHFDVPTRIFSSILNYNWNEHPGEVNNEPSMTQPNLAYTVPELLARFKSGRSADVKLYDTFGSDTPVENATGTDIRNLDISEVHELLETLRNDVEKVQHEQNRRAQVEKDQALEKSIIAKHELAQKQKQAKPIEPVYLETELPFKGEKPKNEG